MYLGANSALSPYPWALALDSNDAVYALVADKPTTTGSTPVTQTGVGAMKSDGTTLYNYTGSASTTYVLPGAIATDTLGNLFSSNVAGAAAKQRIRQFTASTGASPAVLTTSKYPQGVAVDRSNDVWYSTDSAAGSNTINEFTLSGTTYNAVLASAAVNPTFGFLAIDSNQNVWAVAPGAGSGATTTTAAAQYVLPAGSATGASLVENTALTKYIPSSTTLPYGSVAFDSAGRAYTPERSVVAAATPTYTGTAVSGFSATTETAVIDATPAQSELDGNGTEYTSVYQGPGKIDVLTAAADTSYIPCYVVLSGASNFCSDNASLTSPYALLQFVHGLQIDSTGSIWVTAGVNAGDTTGLGGRVVQIIGSAVPTWPQLSWGHPGVEP